MQPAEVLQAIGGLIQAAIARGPRSSPFVEASASSNKLTVGVRDPDGGVLERFEVTVKATDVPPLLATPQPSDGAGEVASHTDGEPATPVATQAGPAQEGQ